MSAISLFIELNISRTVSELPMQFYDDRFPPGVMLRLATVRIPGYDCNIGLSTTGPASRTIPIRRSTLRPRSSIFGGLRRWFVCPRQSRRVRKLCLPLGARHFRSRRSYRLAYSSQREAVHDRAQRRARKLIHRLGGHWNDDQYPDKPPRMRWRTYNRIMDQILAADRLADERIFALAARWSE